MPGLCFFPFWAFLSSSDCHPDSSHELLAHFSCNAVGMSVENTVGRLAAHRPGGTGTLTAVITQARQLQWFKVLAAASDCTSPQDRPPFRCRPLWWFLCEPEAMSSRDVQGDLPNFLFKQPRLFLRRKLKAVNHGLSRGTRSI